MVQLVSVLDVRNRANLPDNATTTAVVTSALRGVSVGLESRLRTKLDKGSAKEVFYLSETEIPRGRTFRLILRNGFVSNVRVSYMESLEDAGKPLTPIHTDAEFGRVTITSDPDRPVGYHFRYPQHEECRVPFYVVIEYDYGFNNQDPAIPEWLWEAALTYSLQLMAIDQLADPKPDTNSVLKMLKGHLDTTLTGHVRNDPSAIKPIM